MDRLVVILLIAFSSVSLSHWWVATSFIESYGVIYFIMVAIFQLTILCSLFQAERTLVSSTTDFPLLRTPAKVNGLLPFIFMAGCFIASAVLASHNLVVLGWQLNIVHEIMFNSYRTVDFPSLIDQQEQILGGPGEQLMWLIISSAIFMLCCQIMYGRYSKRFTPILLVFTIVAFILFFMMFFGQQDIDFAQSMQNRQYHWSGPVLSALSMAIEPSLVGFGIFFVFKFTMQKTMEQSFIVFGVVVAATLSALLALAGWIMAQKTSGVPIVFAADNLIILVPLYIDSLASPTLTMSLWTICFIALIAIKTTILSGVCSYILATYLLPYFDENKILMPVLITLLATTIMLVSNMTTDYRFFDISVIFQDIDIAFFYFWIPVQIAILCLLAFSLPEHEHSNFLPTGITWMGNSVRSYYMLLAVFAISMWFYRIFSDLLHWIVR